MAPRFCPVFLTGFNHLLKWPLDHWSFIRIQRASHSFLQIFFLNNFRKSSYLHFWLSFVGRWWDFSTVPQKNIILSLWRPPWHMIPRECFISFYFFKALVSENHWTLNPCIAETKLTWIRRTFSKDDQGSLILILVHFWECLSHMCVVSCTCSLGYTDGWKPSE